MQRLLWIGGFLLLTIGIAAYMSFATPLESVIIQNSVQATVEAVQLETAEENAQALDQADATRQALELQLETALSEKEQ